MSLTKGPYYHAPPLPQDALDSGRVLMRDGSVATLRPVSSADREALLAFLTRLSPESLTKRYFAGTPPKQAVEQLLRPASPSEHLVLLVCTGEPGAEQIIAVGEYTREEPGGDTAEVAFLVADAYQGRGLGTALLERLALIAARQGIRSFRAYTQARNRRMLEVFRQSGFDVYETPRADEVEVRFALEPSETSVAKAELRERIATVASLVPFFKPRSVAVVGASRKPASIGRRILTNLLEAPFQGEVYAINPNADEVAGLKAYPSLASVPGPVDLAIIAVPRQASLEAVRACGEKGVRALVIITAGFAETGEEGRALQARLVATARGYGMRVVGPNCLGLINTDPAVELNASFAPTMPTRGPIAMASQSGALGLAVLEYARELGLGISSFVSLGNKADVSGNDLLQYWEDDPQTGVILLYLESFGNPRRFARLARRVGRKKPILVVKAGRSTAGSRAAGSHTAALASNEVAIRALFEQTGVVRADTLEELFDIAAFFTQQPLPAGPNAAVISNAGGPAILAADTLEAGRMQLPELSETTQGALRGFLLPAASVKNPVDMIASAQAEDYRRAIELVLADPKVDAALILFVSLGLFAVDDVAAAIGEAVAAHRRAGGRKPVVACLMTGSKASLSLTFEEERVPSYRFPEAAARALARAYHYARWVQAPLGRIPDHPDIALERARSLCRAASARGGGWLAPDDVAELFAAFRLPLVQGRMAAGADEAVEAAEALGYPVAVKLASRTIVHKAEWEGVQLELKDADEVRAACARIRHRLERAGRAAELEGYLVQPMVPGGVELMVGVTHDPHFGPLIGFGLGGVHVEILRDVVFRITPLSDRDAKEMIRAIRGFRLLEGYRGHPPADLEAIEELLLRLSRLVEELPEIAELDINPVKAFAPGQGCLILDARVRVREA
jgi:acetyl coenzyme A synthetase (ADP forming)-like protein